MVDDPDVAETLCPTTFPFGTKRTVRRHRLLHDLQPRQRSGSSPQGHAIETITERGIDIGGDGGGESIEVDDIVYAIGFDAMTGPLVGVDIEGRDGITLKEKWVDGPHTYLGLTSVGFPNLFMITGPQSPSVLSNMVVSIEQHVDWVMDTITDMREQGLTTIEPTPTAEAGWNQHVTDCADITLFPQANSWYMGANVPGKPRVFLPYVGGVDTYRETCDRVVDEGYLGFRLTGRAASSATTGSSTGSNRRRHPAEDDGGDGTAAARDARRGRGSGVHGAIGPDPGAGPRRRRDRRRHSAGAAGDLDYRLYRPATPGPHPVVCYYHGGGWVLGHTSPTIRSVATCAIAPARSWCRSTIATPPKTSSRLLPTTPGPR